MHRYLLFPPFRAALILPLLLILAGCQNDPLDIDISHVKVNPLVLERLDQDLFSLNDGDFEERSARLTDKYGQFYEHYLMGFICRKGTADTGYRRSILSFVTDRDIRECQQYAQAVYPDKKLQEIMPEVNACVKRFHHHFPKKPLPQKLITCLSGWNYAFAYMDSALSISLDMYLGDTAKFYDMLQYPMYQQRRLSPEYLLPDIARGWLLTEFDKFPTENTLLHHTIFYGKLYYAVNALLPGTADSLLIGYTGKQLQYCDRYEKNLWSYFAEKNRLYENNLNTIRELTSEGPFTGAISKECPPRIAMWVGWQIIKSYMRNNPEITLEQLMEDQDFRKILNKSRYRP